MPTVVVTGRICQPCEILEVEGLQGEKGDKGDKGDPGEDGVDGIDGASGTNTPIQVYTGAVPPAGPDDETKAALWYPTGGGTLKQWDVASGAWV